MISKKQIVKKVLTCFLALSMIAGTGAVAVGASAKSVELPASVTEKIETLKEWIAEKVNGILPKEKVDAFIAQVTEKVMAEYQTAEAKVDAIIAAVSEKVKAELEAVTGQSKELISQIVDEMMASLPEETRDAVKQVLELFSREGMDEEYIRLFIRQFISEFANELYSKALTAVEMANQAYEDAKAKTEAITALAKAVADQIKVKTTEVLEQVKALEAAIKERAGKYTITKDYVQFKEGDFTYNIYIDLKRGVSATVVGYEGTDTDITIPAKADLFDVTGVFLSTNTEITTVNLPATIEYLDGLSFLEIPSLQYVFVDAENPKYQSVDGVVFSKDGSTLVYVPSANDYSPAEGVTAIGHFAYAFSQNKTVELPSTIQTIGNGAFMVMTNLEEITIPDGVEKISYDTFLDCTSLKKITIPSSVKQISDDAFYKVPEDAVFYCANGADEAVTFAILHNFQVSAPLYAEFEATQLVMLGADASFTINAAYGAGNYTYSFLIRKEGTEKWTKLQMNKENNSIYHSFNSTGTYEVCMKVKDAKGKTVKQYSKVKVVQTLNNLSKISSDTVAAGETVTVKGKAIDPKTTFAVYYKEASASKWIAAQKYDTNKTVDVTFDAAGTYEICVKAKSSLGFISKKYFTVTVE